MLTKCCDKIHIVYDDFNQHDDQPYKRYRVTYYALAITDGIKIGDDNYQNRDHYYSIFKTVEEWQQTMVAPGADPANDGEWVSDCDECYVEQKNS